MMADFTGFTTAAMESCMGNPSAKKYSKCSFTDISSQRQSDSIATWPLSLSPLLAAHSLTHSYPGTSILAHLPAVSSAWGGQTKHPTREKKRGQKKEN